MPLPIDVDAVVFDCDGLLVDTEPGWTRAETAIFAEHGFSFGVAEKEIVIGRTLDAAGTAMADYFGRPGEGPRLAARLRDLVAGELAAGAPALPGARALVEALRGRVPIAVASNSPRSFVAAALASAGLTDLFAHVLGAEDVGNPKPAPDLYLAACATLGAGPARSVAFEDSRTGVGSARAAGLHVVGVPSLPGPPLDVDSLFTTLADPALAAWARAARPTAGLVSGGSDGRAHRGPES
ncbi:HAD family hydrolase [Asanoa siamensis]|uniref:Haloacid dehalogenase n=1 Tax=Asanoa siamensis TaxID=926357 RepID=A0ABQ4CWQ1_9ACTN|nr:HAD family phosphatase [Asanoa siamensis]GIF75718.1 haloacid dehalogenase [Asanoa siamensis]